MDTTPRRTGWLRRHRWSRRALVLAGLGLLLAAGLLGILLSPEELPRFRAQLLARGEVLALADLAQPASGQAWQQNQQFEAAVQQLVLSPVSPAGIDLMQRTTGGLARVSWRQPVAVRSKPNPGTWEAFLAQVDMEATALQELGELLEQPLAGALQDLRTLPVGTSVASANLLARRRAAQGLAGALVAELHRGRLDAGLTNLYALIGLGRRGDTNGLLIDRMIQVSCAGLALAGTWETLQAPGWDGPRLAALQSAWQRVELLKWFARTAEIERAYALEFFAYARTNNPARKGLSIGILDATNPVAQLFNESFYTPVWQRAWSKGEEFIFLQTMQPILESLREVPAHASYQRLRTQLEASQQEFQTRHQGLNRFRFQLTAQCSPNWRKASLAALRTETLRQMTLAALGLRRYELDHGTLPEDLALLTPAYLPSLPRDFMDGRPLRYRRLAPPRFQLYSVGENAIDEDGGPDDVVWPEPEPGVASESP